MVAFRRAHRPDEGSGLAYEDITCEQFIRSLADGLAGELTDAERERNARHAAACTDCASYRKNYEAVVRAGRETGEETPPPVPDELARLILSSRHRPH